MSMDNAIDFLIAFLVIMVVALQVQIVKLNKKLDGLTGGAAKK